jgi:hypothetical protein
MELALINNNVIVPETKLLYPRQESLQLACIYGTGAIRLYSFTGASTCGKLVSVSRAAVPRQCFPVWRHNTPAVLQDIQYFSFCTVLGNGSWDSVAGMATGYGLDDRGVGVRVPVGSRIFSSPRSPGQLWGPHNLLSNEYRGLFPVGQGVKLTTHLQLAPRSRKCGSIHPLPHTPSWRSA